MLDREGPGLGGELVDHQIARPEPVILLDPVGRFLVLDLDQLAAIGADELSLGL